MKSALHILSLVIFPTLICTAGLNAQNLAVKSDLAADALLSPNLGVEAKLSARLTLEAVVHYNPFPAGRNKRRKHWLVRPELRYWTCQPYGGHFFGAHLVYGVYNFAGLKLSPGLFEGLRRSRYEGDFMGVGLSYGYHFILSPRWSIETSVGVGLLHTDYERYRCLRCGEQTGSGSRNFVAPTRAAVSLVYILR